MMNWLNLIYIAVNVQATFSGMLTKYHDLRRNRSRCGTRVVHKSLLRSLDELELKKDLNSTQKTMILAT